MEDLLKQSALAYFKLSAYRYHYILGRKGKLYAYTLAFPQEAYKHLAGLHKTRIEAFKVKKSALMAVLSGKVSETDVVEHREELYIRWSRICCLQAMIEANACVFRYRGHEFRGSTIKGEYLIADRNTMFFINDGVPVSLFCPTDDQLLQVRQCPKMTTLQIQREEIGTGSFNTIFRSPVFQD